MSVTVPSGSKTWQNPRNLKKQFSIFGGCFFNEFNLAAHLSSLTQKKGVFTFHHFISPFGITKFILCHHKTKLETVKKEALLKRASGNEKTKEKKFEAWWQKEIPDRTISSCKKKEKDIDPGSSDAGSAGGGTILVGWASCQGKLCLTLLLSYV